MHRATIFVLLLAAVSYATPAPQHGRWTPEWESQRAADAVAGTSTGPYRLINSTSTAAPRNGTVSTSTTRLPAPTTSISTTKSPVPTSVVVVPSSPAATSQPSSSAAATILSNAKPNLLGNPNAKPNPAPNAKLSADLITAASASSRMQVLNFAVGNGTADFKFDFNPAANPGVTPGLGGAVILANRANFPALTGLGVAFAGLFFAPCGLNTPHTHPRATEVLTLVTPGTLSAGFVFENTFNMEVSENLTQFQGMAFPMGSIHWQLNNECTPQVAIAGFSDEDPGASSIAQNFFVNTRQDIVEASLGFPSQITSDNFKTLEANIPRAFAMGIKDCYARCNIKF